MNKQAAISTRRVDNLGTRWVKLAAWHRSGEGHCSGCDLAAVGLRWQLALSRALFPLSKPYANNTPSQ